MKKIEYSLSTIKSLHAMSQAGSEDEDIVDIDDEDETGVGEEEGVSESETLSMSDEEFEKMEEGSFTAEESDDKDDENNLGDGDDVEAEVEVNEDDVPSSAEEGTPEQTETEVETAGDQPIDNSEDTAQYEATYKQLFGEPIKASGREVKLRDANHARNLIEMGVDYNKKMQKMRPHMQTLKTLEKEGLLGDPEQLNLLLEVKQGNPEAIKKFIAQANIDVLDIEDTEGAESYTPQNHMVSEQEVAIGEALSAIKESPKYNDTINVMQNVLDPKSREIISENPEYITALNQDIESGVYEGVMEAVQYKKDIRAVPAGMSDIELYIATVQELADMKPQPTPAPVAPTAQPEPTQVNRRSTGASRKRKAGMSGSRGARKKKEPNFDPIEALSMSDDAFEKQFGDQLL